MRGGMPSSIILPLRSMKGRMALSINLPFGGMEGGVIPTIVPPLDRMEGDDLSHRRKDESFHQPRIEGRVIPSIP